VTGGLTGDFFLYARFGAASITTPGAPAGASETPALVQFPGWPGLKTTRSFLPLVPCSPVAPIFSLIFSACLLLTAKCEYLQKAIG
jgi:hypothetical protein